MSELTQSQWSARIVIAFLAGQGISRERAYRLLNVAKIMGLAITITPTANFRAISVKFDGTTYSAV